MEKQTLQKLLDRKSPRLGYENYDLYSQSLCVITDVSFLHICSVTETEINMSRVRGGDGVWSHGVGAGTVLNVGVAGRGQGHFCRVGAGEKITPRAGLYW